MIKAEFRFFLVDFVPFLNFCIGVGRVAITFKKSLDFLLVLNFFFSPLHVGQEIPNSIFF